jgi:hypothetical protein
MNAWKIVTDLDTRPMQTRATQHPNRNNRCIPNLPDVHTKMFKVVASHRTTDGTNVAIQKKSSRAFLKFWVPYLLHWVWPRGLRRLGQAQTLVPQALSHLPRLQTEREAQSKRVGPRN